MRGGGRGYGRMRNGRGGRGERGGGGGGVVGESNKNSEGGGGRGGRRNEGMDARVDAENGGKIGDGEKKVDGEMSVKVDGEMRSVKSDGGRSDGGRTYHPVSRSPKRLMSGRKNSGRRNKMGRLGREGGKRVMAGFGVEALHYSHYRIDRI